MIYGEKLKNLRENAYLTQRNLGNILNIHHDAYAQYEREYTIIPLKHLNTLCTYFNVSLDFIFGLTSKINYPNRKQEISKELYILRIKEFRKENKLTQNKLASILHVNQSTIAEYERGTNLIATPFLYTICKNYNISADYLLGKIDSPKYLK